MKIVCNKQDLLNGLLAVSRAIPVKTTMSILECVLLDCRGESIKLTANDMELGIESVVEGQVVEKGMIALDARIFLEIVRKLPESEVTVFSDSTYKTTITCEKAKFNLMGKDGEDFSFLPYVERKESILVSQFTLREMIRQTIFSIAYSEGNAMLGGELLEVDGNTLRMVSLDGHRISIRKVSLKESYEPRKVIIPGKSLGEVAKILNGGTEDDVSIFFTDKHVLFEFDRTIVLSRLIEGNYFDIQRMLSYDYETKVVVNRKDFMDCIERSMLLVREGDRRPVIIKIADGLMEMKINSTVGSMNELLDIEKTGRDIMIGFNPRFLMDALRSIDEEQVSLYLVNSKAPVFIRDDGESYNYMILPVNFTTVD